jgi:hypothetical protein
MHHCDLWPDGHSYVWDAHVGECYYILHKTRPGVSVLTDHPLVGYWSLTCGRWDDVLQDYVMWADDEPAGGLTITSDGAVYLGNGAWCDPSYAPQFDPASVMQYAMRQEIDRITAPKQG